MTQQHPDPSDQSLMMNDGERIPRATSASIVTAQPPAPRQSVDLEVGAILSPHYAELSQAERKIVSYELIMEDAAQHLMLLLSRCYSDISGGERAEILRTHQRLVQPGAEFDHMMAAIAACVMPEAEVLTP